MGENRSLLLKFRNNRLLLPLFALLPLAPPSFSMMLALSILVATPERGVVGRTEVVHKAHTSERATHRSGFCWGAMINCDGLWVLPSRE